MTTLIPTANRSDRWRSHGLARSARRERAGRLPRLRGVSSGRAIFHGLLIRRQRPAPAAVRDGGVGGLAVRLARRRRSNGREVISLRRSRKAIRPSLSGHYASVSGARLSARSPTVGPAGRTLPAKV